LTDIPNAGIVKTGSPADILILNHDFRNDILATRDIHMVISKGNVVQWRGPALK
jgi:imidazolonepropionase-like amidohydrolase